MPKHGKLAVFPSRILGHKPSPDNVGPVCNKKLPEKQRHSWARQKPPVVEKDEKTARKPTRVALGKKKT